MKKLQFSAEISQKLQLIQREQAARYTDPDPVINLKNAVLVTGSLSGALYLTVDGRVIAHDIVYGDDDQVPYETTDIFEQQVALLIAADKFDLPELLELLTSRPAVTADCPLCAGTRWFRVNDANGKPTKLVCTKCRGLGCLE